MKKLTFKYGTLPEIPRGYDTFNYPLEQDIFDFMSDRLGDEYRYINHYMRADWRKTEGEYFLTGNGGSIELGKLDIYIDVYVEEREPVKRATRLEKNLLDLMGKKVVTLDVKNKSTDWVNPGKRVYGQVGKVIDQCDGHGLCYKVVYENSNDWGWFDYFELRPIAE